MDRERLGCATPHLGLTSSCSRPPGRLQQQLQKAAQAQVFYCETRMVRLPSPEGSWLGVGPGPDFTLGVSQASRRYSWRSSCPVAWARSVSLWRVSHALLTLLNHILRLLLPELEPEPGVGPLGSPDLVQSWARQPWPELTFQQVSPGMGGCELTRHPEKARVLIWYSKETAAKLCLASGTPSLHYSPSPPPPPIF